MKIVVLINDGSPFFERSKLLLNRASNIKLVEIKLHAVNLEEISAVLSSSSPLILLARRHVFEEQSSEQSSIFKKIIELIKQLNNAMFIAVPTNHLGHGVKKLKTNKEGVDLLKDLLGQHSFIELDADYYISTPTSTSGNIKDVGISTLKATQKTFNGISILCVDEFIYSILNGIQLEIDYSESIVTLTYEELKKFLIVSEEFDEMSHTFFSSSVEEKKLANFNLKSQKLLNYFYQDICSFERIYRYDPGNIYKESSIASMRISLGISLAESIPDNIKLILDCVVPVPETGKYYAQGLASILGIGYTEAIQRREETGRSFEVMNITDRKHLITSKLSIIPDLVTNKNVVLVDEAIFTGTTLKILCQNLRESGANYIFIALPTPPCVQQCPHSMQPARSLLMEYTRISQIAAYYDVNGVFFQNSDSFEKIVNQDENYCTKCFLTGKRPVNIAYD
jgi:adenine/guanine phosphoribosyltransferase-like PRPP-binding protein